MVGQGATVSKEQIVAKSVSSGLESYIIRRDDGMARAEHSSTCGRRPSDDSLSSGNGEDQSQQDGCIYYPFVNKGKCDFLIMVLIYNMVTYM